MAHVELSGRCGGVDDRLVGVESVGGRGEVDEGADAGVDQQVDLVTSAHRVGVPGVLARRAAVRAPPTRRAGTDRSGQRVIDGAAAGGEQPTGERRDPVGGDDLLPPRAADR